ncbi:MAG: DNA polymerase III delta prime subunit [Crocinitomicaceae bacterium]|jgi:DNA polymerase III delta prime subunit
MEEKQKTRKGTPDTAFLLKNGKFLCAEMTTDISTPNKLKNDISACFDSEKNKVSIEDIEGIVLCFNFNITPKETTELRKHTSSFNKSVDIDIWSFDRIAMRLHLDHADLVHQYLDIPLLTGQFVSLETFIHEYDTKGRGSASPLNIPFLHRDEERDNLSMSIEQHDLVILEGAPGVGKSKLAVETIKQFVNNNSNYQAYCVSYKHANLLDDMHQLFDKKKDYVLFVDDANRIDSFMQIVGYYKGSRSGNLKIIMTVRDYAYEQLLSFCKEFSPFSKSISNFSDKEITDIISVPPFEVTHASFIERILFIACGNPRLAIMAANYAREKQNINDMGRVSDLFDSYFGTILSDIPDASNEFNLKCLGLISFFQALPYGDRETMNPICINFNIDYNLFVDVLEELSRLELIEVRYGYTKISEQNLASYYFYKVFIKDEILSISTLLEKYFLDNVHQFRESIISANNNFGYEEFRDKLRPLLTKYFTKLSINDSEYFQFVDLFWAYLQPEVLEFYFEYIQGIYEPDEPIYIIDENKKVRISHKKDDVVDILGNFLVNNSDEFKDALELIFEYVRKTPKSYHAMIEKIKGSLAYSWDDEHYGFYRQNSLFEFLKEKLKSENVFYHKVFWELCKTFLLFSFNTTRSSRGKVLIGRYTISNNEHSNSLRNFIWEIAVENYGRFPVEGFEFLKIYGARRPDVTKDILELEISFVLQVIDDNLICIEFDHCFYVQDQIQWWEEKGVDDSRLEEYRERFINYDYKLFLLLDWDRFRNKKSFQFDNYDEFLALKKDEIRKSISFKSKSEFEELYLRYLSLKDKLRKNTNDVSLTFDTILEETANREPKLAIEFLTVIMERGNELYYVPNSPFSFILINQKNFEFLLNQIDKFSFAEKSSWKLMAFYLIDEKIIIDQVKELFIEFLRSLKTSIFLRPKQLEKYLVKFPNIFQEILEIVVAKSEAENVHINLGYGGGFFSEYLESLGSDRTKIRKGYIQQLMHDSSYDYDHEQAIGLLNEDPEFLLDIIKVFIEVNESSVSGTSGRLKFIWDIQNVEPVLFKLFDLAIERTFSLSQTEHFCNSFFNGMSDNNKRARGEDFVLNYLDKNYGDSRKVNTIVNIARNSLKSIFDKVLIKYISLNPSKVAFSEIIWVSHGVLMGGDVNRGDMDAASWSSIEKTILDADLGIKSRPIKTYVRQQIEQSLAFAEEEKKRRFLRKD